LPDSKGVEVTPYCSSVGQLPPEAPAAHQAKIEFLCLVSLNLCTFQSTVPFARKATRDATSPKEEADRNPRLRCEVKDGF
jgi:hypothetical protein